MHKTLYSREHKVLLQLLTQSRLEAALTQVELAKRLKEDQTWVSKVERGIRRLDLVELAFWCSAMNLPLSTFVRRYEDMLGASLNHSQHSEKPTPDR